MRKFIVYDKLKATTFEVEGEEALAKAIGVPVTDIPDHRLMRVTINKFSIVEFVGLRNVKEEQRD